MHSALLGIVSLFVAGVCAVYSILEYFLWPHFSLVGVALFVLLTLVGIWGFSSKKPKQRKPKEKQSRVLPPEKPAAAPPKEFEFVGFRVAGVTYSNDDGTDRQTILRHIKFHDAPYMPDDSPTIEIKRSVFNGETAFRILVNGYQIGFVPRDKIAAVDHAIERDGQICDFQVIGGGRNEDGEEISFGCMISIRYRP